MRLFAVKSALVENNVVAGGGDDDDDDITINSDEERDLINEIQDGDMENMKDETKWALELYQLVLLVHMHNEVVTSLL